jgi:hypothetical protein
MPLLIPTTFRTGPEPIEPMTLANMRENGVRSLAVYRRQCHQEADRRNGLLTTGLLTLVASGLLQCNTLGVEGLRRKPVSVRDLRFQVAVRASGDGRFTFQIFTLSGEPRTFHAGSQTYATPADAAQAGREAIAANCQ